MKKILLSLLLVCSVSISSFADLRKGALPGEFKVSPTKTVHFSSGNYQCTARGFSHRFAEHQYDIIAGSNKNISSLYVYTGYFDLFGWGQVYFTYTTNPEDYLEYKEWGEYEFENADNSALWRTLTGEEWRYLLFESGCDMGLATITVEDKTRKGLVLLPEGKLAELNELGMSFVTVKDESKKWSMDGDYLSSSKTKYTDNEYTVAQWDTLEAVGAVFLPAAYYRTASSSSSTTAETVLDYGDGIGCYWSSTPTADIKYADYLSFSSSYSSAGIGVYGSNGNKQRYTGMSVRLVTEYAEYNPITELEPVEVEEDKETNITFTVNGPSSSAVLLNLQATDFYNPSKQCLELHTTLDDANVAQLMDNILQGIGDFGSVFSGVSFFLPAGSGEIKLDMCTYGFQLSVHIGDAVAHLTQNERGEAVLTYDIPEPTLVCMHALDIDVSSGARRRALRTSDERPRVELYRMKISANTSEGVEGVQDNALCEKIFRDGQLLILRGDKSYTVTGQELK
jgi:hypothetical protein